MQPGSPQDLPDSKLAGAEELMLFVFRFVWTCLESFGKPAVQQRSAARADNVGKDAAALQPCWPLVGPRTRIIKDYQGRRVAVPQPQSAPTAGHAVQS